MLRIDAFGYATKRPGTSCFFLVRQDVGVLGLGEKGEPLAVGGPVCGMARRVCVGKGEVAATLQRRKRRQ